MRTLLLILSVLAVSCASVPERRATEARMTQPTLQGPRSWSPTTLNLALARATAVSSYYDWAALDPRGRGTWTFLDGTAYQTGDAVVFPFVSTQSYTKGKAGLSYGFELSVPDRSYYALNVLTLRADGRFGFGDVRPSRNVENPLVPTDKTVKDGRLLVHPGAPTFAAPASVLDAYRKRLTALGAQPSDFRVLAQDADHWEAIHADRPVYVAWRRQNERLELVAFTFASVSDRDAVLTVTADAQGFDLKTGRSALGWGADGTKEGQAWDGVLDAKGRQGPGTTVYADGRAEQGTWSDDVPSGLVRQYDQGRLAAVGFWKNGVKDGPELVWGTTPLPVTIDTYRAGVKTASRPYVPGPLGATWLWFGEGSPVWGISTDFADEVLRFSGTGGQVSYTVRRADGTLADLQGADGRRGLVRRADGSVYEGELAGYAPRGQGSVLRSAAAVPANLEAELTAATDQWVTYARSVWGQVAQRRAAEEAAALYATLDSLQREVSSQSGRSTALASLSTSLQSSEFQGLKAAALNAAQGSSGLAEYQFRRALESAVNQQNFRDLKDIVVTNLAKDPQYRGLAAFLDTAGDIAQTSWDTARAAAAADQKRRAAAAKQASAGGGNGPVRPPAWHPPKPTVHTDDIQLSTMVQAADEYYRAYTVEARAGRTANADKLYQAHEAAVHNAEAYAAVGSEGGF